MCSCGHVCVCMCKGLLHIVFTSTNTTYVSSHPFTHFPFSQGHFEHLLCTVVIAEDSVVTKRVPALGELLREGRRQAPTSQWQGARDKCSVRTLARDRG